MDTSRIDVTETRLRELLELGTETWFLDFKTSMNLTDTKAKVEFAKDVAAFSDQGGWIVIGADSSGRATSWDCVEREWDSSAVSAKVSRYLSPGYRLYTAIHNIQGYTYVLIQVLPHVDGVCVMKTDGNVPGKTRSSGTPVFREGDIYTREEQDSVKASQRSLNRILNKRAKNVASREQTAALARKRALEGPLSNNQENAQNGQLCGQIGWSTTGKPNNLTEKLFFSNGQHDSFETFLFGLLESKHLRREGHSYKNEIQRTADYLRSYGLITHSDQDPGYCDVRVYRDGSIQIYFEEETFEWNSEELLGWWAYGATEIAYKIIEYLGLHGVLFASYSLPVHRPFAPIRIRDISRYQDIHDGVEGNLVARANEDINYVASNIIHYRSLSADYTPTNWARKHDDMLLPRSSWALTGRKSYRRYDEVKNRVQEILKFR